MRQLTVTAPRHVSWSEVPAPQLSGPRAALVRPIAIATCDFDHLIVSGAVGAPPPIAIGHELVAQVIEVGSAVRTLAPGDQVLVPFQIACGECQACRRGHTSACAAVPWLSCYGLGAMAGDWGGAAADLVRVPYADAMLVPLPPGLAPSDAAAMSCNVVDAYRCVGPQLAAHPGADVLIVAGAFANIALYCVAIARGLGAGRIDFVSQDSRLTERAARLGARIVSSAEELSEMDYPITVDASMDPALLSAAVRATARAGVCTISTMYASPDVQLPLFAMFERCITLHTGQPHARAFIDPVLELWRAGKLDLAPVVDAVLDWEDAPRAFSAGVGKLVCVRQ